MTSRESTAAQGRIQCVEAVRPSTHSWIEPTAKMHTRQRVKFEVRLTDLQLPPPAGGADSPSVACIAVDSPEGRKRYAATEAVPLATFTSGTGFSGQSLRWECGVHPTKVGRGHACVRAWTPRHSAPPMRARTETQPKNTLTQQVVQLRLFVASGRASDEPGTPRTPHGQLLPRWPRARAWQQCAAATLPLAQLTPPGAAAESDASPLGGSRRASLASAGSAGVLSGEHAPSPFAARASGASEEPADSTSMARGSAEQQGAPPASAGGSDTEVAGVWAVGGTQVTRAVVHWEPAGPEASTEAGMAAHPLSQEVRGRLGGGWVAAGWRLGGGWVAAGWRLVQCCAAACNARAHGTCCCRAVARCMRVPWRPHPTPDAHTRRWWWWPRCWCRAPRSATSLACSAPASTRTRRPTSRRAAAAT
jgi:hypothetical protein